MQKPRDAWGIMGELVKIVLLFGGIGILLLVAWIAAAKLGLLKPGDGAETPQTPVPYCVTQALLTVAEANFYHVLAKAMPSLASSLGKAEPPMLLMKVRLADVLQVDSAKVKADRAETGNERKRGGWQSAQNRINCKHADFVLVAPASAGQRAFAPLLIIELDDATHARSDRQARDVFFDRACAAAGLPVLHVPVSRAYDPAALVEKIKGVMNKPMG